MVKRLAYIVAFSIAMPPALAQTAADVQARHGSGAYLQDSRDVVVRSPFGLCWRSGTWTTGDALIGCDGQLTPPIANPTAPEPALPSPSLPVAQSPAAPLPCDFTVTLANDEIFSFNKSALSQPARGRLDEQVVGRLAACSRIDRLTVFGHADRLGTPQYNRKLSERRAGAVADYLKSKGKFAEIETRGLGETQPTASCANSLPRRALVECLTPDRRIVIEVRGIAK